MSYSRSHSVFYYGRPRSDTSLIMNLCELSFAAFFLWIMFELSSTIYSMCSAVVY